MTLKLEEEIRVLAVDDKKADLWIIEKLLSDDKNVKNFLSMIGYTLTMNYTSSGEEALESARRFNPDVVLMDVMMPGMDGYESTRRILQIHPTCQILILSAKVKSDNDIQKGIDANIAGFINKPFKREDLLTNIVVAKKKREKIEHDEKLKKAIIRAKLEWETTVDSVRDLVLLTDLHGTIIRCNKVSIERLSFGNFTELLGQDIREVFYGDHDSDDRFSPPEEFVHKDLGELEFPQIEGIHHATVSPIEPLEGRRGFVYTLRDVTAIRKADDERRKLEEQLMQAHKMDAIGQLAGGVAHDFNNLLTGIRGYAELLVERFDKDSREKKYIDAVFKASNRATDLTKQLLAFARKGKYQVYPLDIDAIVKEVLEFLEHTIDKNIVIKHELNAGTSTVSGDYSQIHNVLLNLAVNARDAMPDGGELTFETNLVDIDAAFSRTHIDVQSIGPHVVLCVRDTGTGMSQETTKHIFEPFFTTKGVNEGTGMGLATVYGIVKNHGGFIQTESQLGRGSEFRICLPQTMDTTLQPEPITRKKMNGKGRVLIVDDEEMIRNLAVDQLSQIGFTVYTAADGIEAESVFREYQNQIDLVVLDLIMPNRDGMETFQILREIDPEIRIILLSGYSVNEEVQRLLECGALDFVEKPYQIDDLALKISQGIESHPSIDDTPIITG